MSMVTLVKRSNQPISVGVGKFCFSLVNNEIAENEASKIGCELRGPQTLSEYNAAFDLARFAWEIKEFDAVEEH